MTSFGRFETVSEIHRMGHIVVYGGRASEGTAEEFTIKVFQPPALLLEEERVETEIRLFLNSAAVQQKVAAHGADHWAPIHQHGTTPEGAFYVTDKHERSLQQLIDVCVKLSGEDLSIIIGAVATGLLELKRSCERPHGDLKATNIMVGGTGRISERTVVLCDPLPDDHVDTSVHWDTDLLAVAEAIYQLVVYRPSPSVEGWQAPDAEEWQRLGREGSAWRNLCNRLFAAATRPGTIDLETLIQELDQLERIRSRKARYRWPVAAGLIVVACVIPVLMLWRGSAPPEIADWESLCQENIDWVETLHESLFLRTRVKQQAKQAEEREARWSEDEQLRERLDTIKTAAYPLYLGRKLGQSTRAMMKDPNVAATKETRNGLEAVRTIKGFFDANDPNASTWSMLMGLNEIQDRFRTRGWERPAAYLALLADSVKPPSKGIAQNVDKILALQDDPMLEEVESRWMKLLEDTKTIEAPGDPVLSQFGAYVKSQVTSSAPDDQQDHLNLLSEPAALAQAIDDNLQELRDTLGGQDVNDLAGELAAFVAETWPDPNQFAQDLFLASNDYKQDPPGTPTAATFRDRLETMRGYCVVPEMRGEFRASVANIKKLMPLAREINPTEAEICGREFDEFQSITEYDTLDKDKTQSIAKNQSAIEAAIEEHMPRLRGIERRVIAAAEPIEKYRDRIGKEDLAVDPQVNAKWIILRNALLDNDKYRDLKQDDGDYAQKYTDLRRKMEATASGLVSLDQELQSQLPPQIGVEPRPGWNDKIGQFYGQHRRDATERIIATLPLVEEVPDVNDAAFKRTCDAEFTRVDTLRTDLGGVVTAFNAIEDRLDACYLYGEEFEPEVQGAATVRQLWENWRNKPILTEPEIGTALKELTDRIANLEAVDKSGGPGDTQGLVDVAGDANSRPEAVYAAWWRLGTVDNWPATPQDWQTESKIQESLAASFQSLNIKADRAGKLRLILASESFTRHKRIINKNTRDDRTLLAFGRLEPPEEASLSDIEKLEQLAEELGQFVVDPNWRDGLYDTSTFAAPNGPDNTVTDDIDATDAAMRAWLEEVKTDYRVIDDSREPDLWTAKAKELGDMIEEGLKEVEDANDVKHLEEDRTDLDELDVQFKSILKLSAITKHEAEINAWGQLWDTNVPALEDQITSHIRPRYCQYLEMSDGKVAFKAGLGLSRFEPVDYQGPDFDLVSLSGLREFEKQEDATLKTRFFDERSLDENDAPNFGWPKYIRFKPDPSLRLRFIPGDPSQGIPSFYMALHEITNAQYAKFLTDRKARGGDYGLEVTDSQAQAIWIAENRLHGVDKEGRSRIGSSGGRFTAEPRYENHPAVWVTARGAQEFAEWLDPGLAQLPQASWHQHGVAYNEAPNWHVRGTAWEIAVDAWNSFLAQNPTMVTQAPPLGAADQEYCDAVSDPAKLATLQAIAKDTGQNRGSAARGKTCLPCPILNQDGANLCDLVGNAWEWCVTSAGAPVLCGGSCLSGPEHTRGDAELQYPPDKSSRDVGFRVVVVPPAP